MQSACNSASETDDGQLRMDDITEFVNKSLALQLERDDADVGYQNCDKTYIGLLTGKPRMDVYLKDANRCYSQSKYDDAVTHCNKCIVIATEINDIDIEKKATCLLELAKSKKSLIFEKNGEVALLHNKKALEIAEGTDDQKLLMKVYFEMAWLDYFLGKYSYLMSYLKRACRLAKDLRDVHAEMEAYLHMSANYRLANNRIQEISLLKKALEMLKKPDINNERFMLAVYLNQVEAFRSLGQEQNAKKALENYFAATKEMGDGVRRFFVNMILSFLNGTGDKFIHEFMEQHLDRNKQTVGFELIVSICYVCINMSWHNTYVAHEIWVKFVAQTAGRNFGDMMNGLSTAQFDMVRNMLRLAVRYELTRYVSVVATHPAVGIIHGTDSDVLSQNDSKSINDFVKSLVDIGWQSIMEEDGIVFHSSIERKALLLSSWGVTLYFFGQSTEAEKFLRESVGHFESIFDVEKVENYQMCIVDRFIDTYKILFKLLWDTKRDVEALLVADRCHAKALKSCLSSKHQASDEINEKDIGALVVEEKYAILFYAWCFNDLCIFLIQGSKDDNGRDIAKLSFHIQRDIKPFIDKEVKNVLGQMDALSLIENRGTVKESGDESTPICTCCESIRGPPSEHDDDSYLIPDETNTSEYNMSLEKLHGWLLSPLKDKLTAADKIVIIPEGKSLYSLPFAALRDSITKCCFSDDKQLRFSPSLTNLKLHRQVSDDYYKTFGSLIVGDPHIRHLESLTGSRNEAKEIAEIIGGVAPLIGPVATKQAVVERMSDVCIIHFAGHMLVEGENSAIILAPSNTENQGNETDVQLTPEDISKMEVHAKLVVLSGCNSGRGKITAEGVVGLARAFLAAGAGAVLVSRWKVNDRKTCEFMTTFYKYLLDWRQTRSANESLLLTINDMRRKYQNRPEFWSGFFLMGDDVTIDRNKLSVSLPAN